MMNGDINNYQNIVDELKKKNKYQLNDKIALMIYCLFLLSFSINILILTVNSMGIMY